MAHILTNVAHKPSSRVAIPAFLWLPVLPFGLVLLQWFLFFR